MLTETPTGQGIIIQFKDRIIGEVKPFATERGNFRAVHTSGKTKDMTLKDTAIGWLWRYDKGYQDSACAKCLSKPCRKTHECEMEG